VKTASLKTLCQELKKGKRFLVCSHIEPEGDTGGAALALNSLLRRLGKKSWVICDDPVPEQISFLGNHVEWHQTNHFKRFKDIDTFVIVDAPSLQRAGQIWNQLPPHTRVINIDHHVSNEFFGDVNYVDVKSAACGEIIYDVFKAFKMRPNKEEAIYLYIAISTDTGSFRYSNTTVRTHRLISELIASGLDVADLNDRLYSIYNPARLKLYSMLLNEVKVNAKKKIGWSILRNRFFKQTHTTPNDANGFIDFLKYLKGVKAVFLVIETRPQACKVSFRSKGSFNVNRIAQHFGGGGHKKASGCNFMTSPDQAVGNILRRLNG
jgi:phosphoesterase RecJ-like protein